MFYLPAYGGANKCNRILLEGLAERKHSCWAVARSVAAQGSWSRKQFLEQLAAYGINTISSSSEVDIFSYKGVRVHAVINAHRLRDQSIKRIHELDPTWLIVSSEDPGQSLLETALRICPRRVIYIAHAPQLFPFGPASFSPNSTGTELLRQVAAILAIGRRTADYIQRYTGLKPVTIHPPCYGSGPFPNYGNFTEGFITIVNPSAVKGISIFVALAKRFSDYKFAALLGWSTTHEDREALAKLPNVQSQESVKHIDEVFAKTRILLVPSLYQEGFGLIATEAMLRGIPVLASDFGGLPEAKLGIDYLLPIRPIEQYEDRCDDRNFPIPIIPDQDIGPWVEALQKLLSDREHYIQLSEASRKAALAFVSNLGIDPFEDFLQKLVPINQANISRTRDRTQDQASKMDDLSTRIDNLSPERRALLALKLAKKDRLIRKKQTITQLSRSKISNYFPLSFAQQRLWLVDQLEPNNPAYNIPMAYRFAGKLDVPALKQSLSEIVRRHEILRTTFTIMDGQSIQVIAPTLSLSLPVVNLNDVPATQQQAKVQQTLLKEAQRPFDLRYGPLLRTNLLQLGEEEYIFIVTMHHIVSDGWSMGVFVRELNLLYQALSANRPSTLPDIPIQYADYTVWQRQWLTGEVLETRLNYWKRQLGGQLPLLGLPTDHPRPPTQTYEGAKLSIELPKSLTEQINKLSRQEGVTPFMTLLAAFKTLLHRHTGQDDIVVGSPIANRNRKEIEGLIGFFVNTLVLRTDLSGSPTFRELLRRVRNVALGAYAHQDLPFERLLEELQPERDLSRSPLFQVFFNMLNFEHVQLSLYGLKIENFSFSKLYSKFDLTVHVSERNQQIQLLFVYNTDLFEDGTIVFMLDSFKTLLENIVVSPERRISELRLLDRAKWLQLTTRRNLVRPTNPFAQFERQNIEQSIPRHFEHQVQEHPSNIAIKTSEDEWTYDTLNKTANRAATRILESCGSAEERIGLLFEHDAQMIAAILAVSKAGKVYVPLDPFLPTERINFMLNDSQAATLLTNNTNLALAESLKKGQLQVINVDDIGPETPAHNINLPILPEAVAYILYTSGSTGRPKGVVQTHRNVLYHIRNYTNGLHIDSGDRLTLFSNYSFDAAMMDVMGALLNGATLCPMDLKEKSLVCLSEWLIKEKITIYHSTPTVYRYLISTLTGEEEFPRIRLVVLGGEEVYKKDVDMYKEHFSPDCIFVNTYGPTESTIVLQYFVDQETKITRNTVPLGYLVDDTEILLLDKKGEVTDVYGEIAIRSDNLAIGYWRKHELMDEVFLPDGGYRGLYRTGDIGRLLPDGSIEFKGRKDLQIKIRGFRVEPGEIESALCSYEAVKECVVATSDNGHGDNKLIAYVVCNESLSSLSLRRYLRDYLPDYMIPSEFIQLDSIPLIHNGKTDYASLSLLRDSHAMQRPDYAQPIGPVEKKIAEIWQSVLDVDKISLPDNFFDLGGHSLMVVKAISLIEKELGIHVPFREFFNQTLRQFAASCEEKLLSKKHDCTKEQY